MKKKSISHNIFNDTDSKNNRTSKIKFQTYNKKNSTIKFSEKHSQKTLARIQYNFHTFQKNLPPSSTPSIYNSRSGYNPCRSRKREHRRSNRVEEFPASIKEQNHVVSNTLPLRRRRRRRRRGRRRVERSWRVPTSSSKVWRSCWVTDNVFLLSCLFFRRFFLLLFLLPFQAIPPSLLPSYIDRGISLLHTRITESRFSRFYQVGWLVGWSVDCLHPFVRCSICRQTRLFRADHKGTMMSYFVNGRRVRLIESNLGRRSCFFVISHGASYTHPPLFPLSFYPFFFV